jgi:two-component system, NtrC family, sensor histidine kinase PilS
MNHTLQDWLSWLIKLRIVVITTLLGVSLGVSAAMGDSRPLTGLSWLIGAVYAGSVVFYLLLRHSSHLAFQAYFQTACDLITTFFIIRVTGGVESSFSFLYLLSIIMASILRYRKGAFLTAFFSSLLFSFEYLLAWQGRAMPGFSSSHFEMDIIKFNLLMNLFAFYAVAYLSSVLTEGLRHTGRELQSRMGELASLQMLHQNIIHSMRGGLCTTNLDGIITLMNPFASEITGIEQDKAIGMAFQTIFGFAEWEPPDLSLHPMIRFEKSLLNNGREIHLGFTAARLTNENNQQIGYIFTFRDLTEIKALEEQVRQKERMAALGRIAAGIAHEIRNPLTAISGSFKLLGPMLPTDPDNQRLMENISQEIKRLYQIVTDFLSYCRPIQFHPRRIELDKLVSDILQILSNSSEKLPGHTVEYRASPPTPILITADPDLIRQVLWNLCTNAFKAMPGGGLMTLELRESDPGGVGLTVQDTGVGMAPEEVRRIFEPFYSGFKSGTGLGLPLVSQIMESHRGTISVKSEPGRGTTFSLRFPKDFRPEKELTAAFRPSLID